MTIRTDERSADQKRTHTVLVTATDRFMSGWGGARGGASKCAWACRPEHAKEVFDWVSARDEMKYVNVVYSGRWYPVAARVRIYVADIGHPAIRQGG